MKELPLIKPMLADTSTPFDSKDFIFEIKWDGYRALAYLNGGFSLISRNGKNITKTFPELDFISSRVSGKPVVLDGEIIVLQEGKPSFNILQKRGRLEEIGKIKSAAMQYPAIFMVFDVLYYQGENIMNLPLMDRKDLLNCNLKTTEGILISEFIKEEGIQFSKLCMEKGLEGVVGKKINSPYLPGRRTKYWKKIRNTKETDLIICGFQAGKGNRKLGSLILGGYKLKKLMYQGKVGTGFSVEEENFLLNLLSSIITSEPPLDIPEGEKSHTVGVKPELVCTVKYLTLTGDGLLRHPVYKGLRKDKNPEECGALNV